MVRCGIPEEKYQNASEAAYKKAAPTHSRALFARAEEAVDQQRQRLVLVQDSEAHVGRLREVKLTAEKPDDITVQDLDPIEPAPKELGCSTDYGKRAEARGLTKEDLKAEATARPEGQPTPEEREGTAERIAAELNDIRDPGAQVDPHVLVDAQQAIELIKAEKALKAVQKEAKQKAT
jgi:hypothetical protein